MLIPTRTSGRVALASELGVSHTTAAVLVRRGLRAIRPAARSFLDGASSTTRSRSRASTRPSRVVMRHVAARHPDRRARRLRRRRRLLDGGARARAATRSAREVHAAAAEPPTTATACRGARSRSCTRAAHGLLITADCGIGARRGGGARARARHGRGRDRPPPPRRRAARLPGRASGRLRLPGRAVRDGRRLQARPGALRARPAATRPSSSASSTSSRSRRSPTSCRCVGENRALVRRGLRAIAGHLAAGAARAAARRAASIRRASTSRRSASRSRRASTRPGACTAPTRRSSCCSPTDEDRALEIARELDAINTERQSVETAILFEAERLLAELGATESAARRPALRARPRGLASRA